MATPVLMIKNMVCDRCVMAVEDILRTLEIPFEKVLLGEVHLTKSIPEQQSVKLTAALNKIGFEIIDNNAGNLIEKIKQLVMKRARNEVTPAERNVKLSQHLSDKIHHEYTYLSSLFSEVEGRTIESYFIQNRIEKAKELLVYEQLTISEIAFELEYGSVAHFSTQFKKITGFTPSYYKQLGVNKRHALNSL